MSKLFDKIAPIYGLFFQYQKKKYFNIIEKYDLGFDFSKYETAIDFGCGTGALCGALSKKGLIVTGVDTSEKMIQISKAKNKNEKCTFIKINEEYPLEFDDRSFDISFASYVAHGLRKNQRLGMYNEMNRVSKEFVIIYDYNKKRSLLTNIVEWAEGGDYFNFIKEVEKELNEIFGQIKTINVDKRAALYICRVTK